MFPLGVLKKRPINGYVLDPAKVKLLLHFDGNYNDSSPNNHTMTSGGNVSISTDSPKFGTGKLQFGHTPVRDGFLRSPNLFDFGNKRPFTMSFFYKGGDSDGCFLTTSNSPTYTQMTLFRAGLFAFGNDTLTNATYIGSNAYVDPNTYQHYAVVGDGTRIKGYRDGIEQFDIAHPNWPSVNSFLQFGKSNYSQYSNGGMDEFLLYDGVLWTSNFTPPTAPFTY